MSLFFDYSCKTRKIGDFEVTCTAWSKSEPTFAVGTDDGEINLFQDEGLWLDSAVISRAESRGASPTHLDWQPRAQVLAAAWSDGCVTTHSLTPGAGAAGGANDAAAAGGPAGPSASPVAQNKLVHRGALCFLQWNPAGTRLITGDAAGTVCVWKADARGALSASQQYRRGGPLTAMAFCAGPPGTRADVLSQTFSPSFFFGTEKGAVCYADDLGHCTDVNQLSAAVDCMMFYEEKMRLVIITRSLLMTQLQVGDDGRVVPVMKVKLSVAGDANDRGVREVCWAGPGLLCSATQEKLVRFWDLANDENYVLTVTGGQVERDDRATTVAFNPLQRYLAVGTKKGQVVMWKFEGEYAAGGRAGGGGGRAAGGRRSGPGTSAADWRRLPPTALDGPVVRLAWGPGRGLLGVGAPRGAALLAETVLHRALRDGVAVLQTGTKSLQVETTDGVAFPVTTRVPVKGVAVDRDSLVVWSGKEAVVYQLATAAGGGGGGRGDFGAATEKDAFPSAATAMALKSGADGRDGTIFQAVGSKLEQVNFGGVVLNDITFSEAEGRPVLLDTNGHFLAVATDRGVIKLYNTRRERKAPAQMGSAGRFVDAATRRPLGAMRSIAVNADGTRLSILSDHVHGGSLSIREPDTRLHVYDADKDTVLHHDFGPDGAHGGGGGGGGGSAGHGLGEDVVRGGPGEEGKAGGGGSGAAGAGRWPAAHFWDPVEPKLLACETRRLKGGGADATNKKMTQQPTAKASEAKTKEAGEGKDADEGKVDVGALQAMRSKLLTGAAAGEGGAAAAAEVTTLFVTADYGILMQDAFPLSAPCEGLVGIAVPRLYFVAQDGGGEAEAAGGGGEAKAAGGGGSGLPHLADRVMRDFVGLEDVDPETRAALLDFSYHLTVGNMDAAYRAVKLIHNPSVWENMAHMCVKTKRLDVAEVCLGNMGHARGAAALRRAKRREPELEACVAAVAVQLGLLDDACRLYREAGRWDLLVALYQDAGLWERAAETAARQDRVHLKTVHHRYAQHLEETGDGAGAIQHYEAAGTHQTEVPRMLFERRRVDDLEHYITQGKDPKLLKWWAGYLESKGALDKARRFYAGAEDHLALVRLACYNQDFEEARRLVEKSGSRAAAYHLARQHEARGEVQEAVGQYAASGRYNHAIRLAKAYGMDLELVGFALKSDPAQTVDVARYFELKGEYEKAVELYQKGGDAPKALDLCFKAGAEGRKGVFDALRQIAEGLGEETSPQVLARCAEFFLEHQQFEKAVALYRKGRRYLQAVELCVQHKLKITEEMAEELTPDKDDPGRKEVLCALARACKRQGGHHLACKKYTQAGERLKALKCLLKSGDTKSITYYANVSRNREIYILAANYLQSLDWHNQADTMKSIIQFYTKAKAYEQLSSFYDACAQVEIDEYRDYEKAAGALAEAAKHLAKDKSGGPGREERLAALRQRIRLVEQFVKARRLAKTQPLEMVELCTELLAEPGVEAAVRVGDAFAMLVEHRHGQRDFRAAHELLRQMKQRRIVLNPYVEKDMVAEIYAAVGASERDDDDGGGGEGKGGDGSGSEDEVEDEIDDDVGEELDESLGEESDEEKYSGAK